MKSAAWIIAAILASAGWGTPAGAAGHLVIIGGGERPVEVMRTIVDLAGGPQAGIVIIPNASSAPLDAALRQQHEFELAGSRNVSFLLFDRAGADQDASLEGLAGSRAIFFSGGDQSRLTADLLDTRLLARIREIYEAGGVVSGTSAGAAVMSELMITGTILGDTEAEWFEFIRQDTVELTRGFGFVKAAIVDQHFIARQRQNRLIAAVLEHPWLIGIGIDEATAIHVRPDRNFDVMGVGTVFIVDARRATGIGADATGNLYARDLALHLLAAGQTFALPRSSGRD